MDTLINQLSNDSTFKKFQGSLLVFINDNICNYEITPAWDDFGMSKGPHLSELQSRKVSSL